MTYSQTKPIFAILIALLLLTTVNLSLPISNAFAQDAIEAERDQKFEQLLLLNIPEETDNPNYAIVFTDPSGQGVFIAIDGGEERRVESPYLLPTLAVGSHKLTIRFTDNEETPQTLEKKIIILPRSPLIKVPQTTDTSTIITGTAMPNASVRIFMTGAAKSYKATVVSNDEGNWEYIFKEEFAEGIYTITAITTKNGLASYFADELTFKISSGETVVANGETDGTKPISFSFDSLMKSDPVELYNQNSELIYLVGGVLLFGLLFGGVLSKVGGKRGERRAEDQFLKLLREKSATNKLIEDATKPTAPIVPVAPVTPEKKQEVVAEVKMKPDGNTVEKVTFFGGIMSKLGGAKTQPKTDAIVEGEIDSSKTVVAEAKADEAKPDEVTVEINTTTTQSKVESTTAVETAEADTSDSAVEIPQTVETESSETATGIVENTELELQAEEDAEIKTETTAKIEKPQVNEVVEAPEIMPISSAPETETKTETVTDKKVEITLTTPAPIEKSELTKEEFLTQFKGYDPDDEAAVEVSQDDAPKTVDEQRDAFEMESDSKDGKVDTEKGSKSNKDEAKPSKDRNIKITLTTTSLK